MSTITNGIRKVAGSRKKLGLIMVASVVLLVAVAGLAVMSNYNKLKKENARLSNPQAAAQVETDRLKSEVASLIEVPSDEQPTIATVVDASKLAPQAFFKNAKNGDKVLLFGQAKKAILYRPTTKKIIEVAPINIGNGTASANGTATTGTSTTSTGTTTKR